MPRYYAPPQQYYAPHQHYAANTGDPDISMILGLALLLGLALFLINANESGTSTDIQAVEQETQANWQQIAADDTTIRQIR
ncbi:MAG: hypothetical protein AB7G08_33535, partial [Hyphomicrobiaceae bacterium]